MAAQLLLPLVASSLAYLAPITLVGSGGLVMPKLDIILLTSLAFALRDRVSQIGSE